MSSVVVAEELPRAAAAIIRELLRRDRFNRPFIMRLLETARDANASHEQRCLASLAVEHQFRSAPHDQALVFLRDAGISEGDDVIRARLARSEPIHNGLRNGPAGLRAFLRHTRRECRLFFARYAFTPTEVVAEIRAQSRATRGKRDFPPLAHPCNIAEAAYAMAILPAYEREIVQLLIDGRDIYWVDESTPSAINGLVEYPAGTVVIVIKPPGSDIEIEIKRAGIRGGPALDVRYRNDDGAIVPVHHHLWGGSRRDYLRSEAANSALLSRVHRIVNESEAPIPRIVTMNRIQSVPAADGRAVPLQAHFADPVRRDDLQASLERLDRPGLITPPDRPAQRFLEATRPTQAILVGTTSFRLDRLRAYLADGASFDGDAGELLDEIIDDYEPPPDVTIGERYVAAALAHNRVAADRTYISVLAQIGRFWGSVLGMRGASSGESFVVRNAGLRRMWIDGRWQVRFISMDHDSLTLAGRVQRYYNASKNFTMLMVDQTHILGGPMGKRFVGGEVAALKGIYRVSPQIATAGFAAFRAELNAAYRRTIQAMATDPRIRKLFHGDFLDTIQEWDRSVVDFVRNARDAESKTRWRRRTRARLRRRGLPRGIVDQYVSTIIAYAHVLPWFARMYEENPIRG